MKRFGLVFFSVIIFLSGCHYCHSYPKTLFEVGVTNAFSLMHLTPGMTKEQVLEIMGEAEIETYEPEFTYPQSLRMQETLDSGRKLRIKNPFRKERIPGDDGVMEIYYYYTRTSDVVDHVVTKDELTPVFFRNGKFIGYGDETSMDGF